MNTESITPAILFSLLAEKNAVRKAGNSSSSSGSGNTGGYAVSVTSSASVSLSSGVTKVITGTPASVSVTLSAPSEGKDYLCGVIFKAGSGTTFSDTAPAGHAIHWDSVPTWTAGKIYEIIYRCLWLTDGNNAVVISAKWNEV